MNPLLLQNHGLVVKNTFLCDTDKIDINILKKCKSNNDLLYYENLNKDEINLINIELKNEYKSNILAYTNIIYNDLKLILLNKINCSIEEWYNLIITNYKSQFDYVSETLTKINDDIIVLDLIKDKFSLSNLRSKNIHCIIKELKNESYKIIDKISNENYNNFITILENNINHVQNNNDNNLLMKNNIKNKLKEKQKISEIFNIIHNKYIQPKIDNIYKDKNTAENNLKLLNKTFRDWYKIMKKQLYNFFNNLYNKIYENTNQKLFIIKKSRRCVMKIDNKLSLGDNIWGYIELSFSPTILFLPLVLDYPNFNDILDPSDLQKDKQYINNFPPNSNIIDYLSRYSNIILNYDESTNLNTIEFK